MTKRKPEVTVQVPNVDRGRPLREALGTMGVTNRVVREVGDQEAQWGLQEWPDGTGPAVHPIAPLANYVYAEATEVRDTWRAEADTLEANGMVTWWDILLEEVLEVAAEDVSLENQGLDTELTQVAAVCISWLKDRARRRGATGTPETGRLARTETAGDQE